MTFYYSCSIFVFFFFFFFFFLHMYSKLACCWTGFNDYGVDLMAKEVNSLLAKHQKSLSDPSMQLLDHGRIHALLISLLIWINFICCSLRLFLIIILLHFLFHSGFIPFYDSRIA